MRKCKWNTSIICKLCSLNHNLSNITTENENSCVFRLGFANRVHNFGTPNCNRGLTGTSHSTQRNKSRCICLLCIVDFSDKLDLWLVKRKVRLGIHIIILGVYCELRCIIANIQSVKFIFLLESIQNNFKIVQKLRRNSDFLRRIHNALSGKFRSSLDKLIKCNNDTVHKQKL